MKDTSALVLEIKGNSLDDGPGIRSVVFMKGCPLSCLWCHNPESKHTKQEISFDAGECVGCKTCFKTCEKQALSNDNRFYIDRDICDLCFKCVETCPSGALDRVGHKMTIEEIVSQVVKDKSFFDTSGGGVTLSGGEPTLYMHFVSELLKAFKTEGINTLVETCGQFNLKNFMALVYPYTDIIFYDIKLYDSLQHMKYCGTANEIILKNFEKLYQHYREGGVEVIPRTPLIPDITDTEHNIRSISGFLEMQQVKQAQLMPYHPLWKEKNRKIGVGDSEIDGGAMSELLDRQKIEDCKKMFEDSGIEV